jgi:hypothetical protein
VGEITGNDHMIGLAFMDILNHCIKNVVLVLGFTLQAPLQIPEKTLIKKIRQPATAWIGHVRVREVCQNKRFVRIHGFE